LGGAARQGKGSYVSMTNGTETETGGRTPAGEVFFKGVVEGLCEHRQALRLCLFYGESVGDAAIVVSHLGELSGDFTGEFDAVLDRRIWLERLSLYFFEKIGSCAQELVV
jgi:hypothetical protein